MIKRGKMKKDMRKESKAVKNIGIFTLLLIALAIIFNAFLVELGRKTIYVFVWFQIIMASNGISSMVIKSFYNPCAKRAKNPFTGKFMRTEKLVAITLFGTILGVVIGTYFLEPKISKFYLTLLGYKYIGGVLFFLLVFLGSYAALFFTTLVSYNLYLYPFKWERI